MSYSRGNPYLIEAEPMHSRRPEWLNAEINNNFFVLNNTPPTNYSFHGEESDYPLGQIEEFGAERLVRDLEAKHDRPLKILDIGAAAGGFVLGCLERWHQAQGVSAHDYRKFARFGEITRALPDGAYVIGDANNLSELDDLDTDYDLIVSQKTFMHLIDPLSTLEQTTAKVAAGGTLAMTGIHFWDSYFYAQRGLGEVDVDDVMAGLTRAGFSTDEHLGFNLSTPGKIHMLRATRGLDSNASASFNFGYVGCPEGWWYHDGPQLQEIA
jgi:2-polyprenyl-3-methyl-5-hydroxy-6-metoxy-1,4-benzoquinol methylase